MIVIIIIMIIMIIITIMIVIVRVLDNYIRIRITYIGQYKCITCIARAGPRGAGRPRRRSRR